MNMKLNNTPSWFGKGAKIQIPIWFSASLDIYSY